MSESKRNLIWVGIDKFGSYFLNFIIGIILARLLGPSAYGLIGMVMVFMGVSMVLSTAGFRDAIIRKSKPTNDDYETLQFLNIIVAICIYGLFYFFAPLISKFFGELQLTGIIRVYMLILIIKSISFTSEVRLIKSLNFKPITYISLISNIVSGLIAVILALQGFGVWSLVYQMLISGFLNSLLIVVYTRNFKLGFAKQSFLELWKFSSKMLSAELMNELFSNMERIFVGKYFNASLLGLYTKAERFRDMFAKNVGHTFISVYFPMLSKIQDEPEQLLITYKSMLKNLSFVVFIMMFFLMGTANNFIFSLLGKEWEGAVFFLRILCIAGIFKPIISLNTNLLKVLGRSDLILKNQIINNVLITLNLVVAFFFGIKALVVGVAIYSAIIAYITSRYSMILINYSINSQLRDIFPNFLIGVSFFSCTVILDLVFSPSVPVLLSQIFITITIIAFCGFLFKNTISATILILIKERIKQH